MYRIAGLPSGKYELVAELASFQQRKAAVDVVLNQEAEVNLTLTLAGRSEEVTVVGGSPIIETAKSEMSRTYGSEQIRELPLAGRNHLVPVLRGTGVRSCFLHECLLSDTWLKEDDRARNKI